MKKSLKYFLLTPLISYIKQWMILGYIILAGIYISVIVLHGEGVIGSIVYFLGGVALGLIIKMLNIFLGKVLDKYFLIFLIVFTLLMVLLFYFSIGEIKFSLFGLGFLSILILKLGLISKNIDMQK